MKIAIITLHRVFNYGSILQAYATQKLLEEMGNEVEIIDYITSERTFKKILASILRSKEGFYSKVMGVPFNCLSIAAKQMLFGSFIRRHLVLTKRTYVSAADLRRNVPIADVYVTGSDQVWNSHYNQGIDKGFYLDFAPVGSRRIAYASSFGKGQLEPYETAETKQLISRYSAISVREDSAMDILRGLGFSGATRVLDPTLQRSKEEWKSLAGPRTVRDRYLLLFLLYNEGESSLKHVKDLARRMNLRLVKLSWEHAKPRGVDTLKSHVRPEEFLSLFLNADFVVTNSFHGLAFSINFNKQFVVIPRLEFNTRIESLLRVTRLEARMLSNFEDGVVHERIDYSRVNRILAAERRRGREFLRRALQSPRQIRQVLTRVD